MNAEQLPSIGVIGVGIMGSAMVSNLLANGFTVVAHDVAQANLARVVDLGAVAPGNVSGVCAQVDIVLTSLPATKALESVVAEVAADPGRTNILVETSTFPLSDKEAAQQRLAAAGVAMLDCPLSGTGTQAISRDIVVYASGDEKAYRTCQQVFAGVAKSAPYLGSFGAGTKMKMIANLLVAIHTAAAGEAFALARKAGLDPALTRDLITAGAGSSRSLEARADMLVDQRYLPVRTMPLSLWRKDLSVIAAFAAGLECPTPVFAAVAPLFGAAIALGLGEQDTAAVAAISAQLAGLNGD